jgi:hypothetical protein
VGKTVARGLSREQTDKIRSRIDDSTEEFKKDAGKRIEALAQQIRQLGQQYKASDEANAAARSLERTADYIRFRPSTEIAADGFELARRYRLWWIAGGMLAAAILYRSLKK